MAAVVLSSAAPRVLAQPSRDPFAFFTPTITIGAGDRARLDRGEPISEVLEAGPGEVAIFAAVPVQATPARLVAWMRDIAALKKSEYVLAIARFSDPPRADDLRALALEDEDVEAIGRCRPGNCALKLSAGEMERLRRAAGPRDAQWRARVQQAFRDVVLDRVQTYLARGASALAPYADEEPPLAPGGAFAAILQRSPYLSRGAPELARYIEWFPAAADPRIESFVYWSKEKIGGKASITVTHVSILQGDRESQPEVLVAGRQVFAAHYMTGSLSLTALVSGQGGRRYLAYANRSRVDVLTRWYGGLVRLIVARRVSAEAADVLSGLRRRIDGGDPPTRRP